MFKAPFSFEGRIRRTEYGFSLLLYALSFTILNAITESSRSDGTTALGLLYIPLLWFFWAQGAKRCHDLGNSGWWQIVPFYVFWMLFQEGNVLANEYGQSPKQPKMFPQSFFATTTSISQADEFPIQKQTASKKLSANSAEQDHQDVQITELEIQNINYSLLQETLRTIRTIKSVEALSYEFNGAIGTAAIKHRNSSQELLDELYKVTPGIVVLAVAEGAIKIKLK